MDPRAASTAAFAVRCTSARQRRQRGPRRFRGHRPCAWPSTPTGACSPPPTRATARRPGRRSDARCDTSRPSPAVHVAVHRTDYVQQPGLLTRPGLPARNLDGPPVRAVRSEDGSGNGSALSCPSATLCVATFNVTDGKYFWSLVASANPSAVGSNGVTSPSAVARATAAVRSIRRAPPPPCARIRRGAHDQLNPSCGRASRLGSDRCAGHSQRRRVPVGEDVVAVDTAGNILLGSG